MGRQLRISSYAWFLLTAVIALTFATWCMHSETSSRRQLLDEDFKTFIEATIPRVSMKKSVDDAKCLYDFVKQALDAELAKAETPQDKKQLTGLLESAQIEFDRFRLYKNKWRGIANATNLPEFEKQFSWFLKLSQWDDKHERDSKYQLSIQRQTFCYNNEPDLRKKASWFMYDKINEGSDSARELQKRLGHDFSKLKS